MIVRHTPRIKPRLALDEVPDHTPLQNFCIQRAMKPFVLTLRLRVIRSPVRDPHSQTQQPHRQCRPGTLARAAAPRRSVIHQHPPRQTVMTERTSQPLLHRRMLLVRAGLQHHRIPRMVVQHRQRMAPTPTPQLEVSFEIHLPQFVRLTSLEAYDVPCSLRLRQLLPTTEDLRDRACRRNSLDPRVLQPTTQLATTPRRVSLSKRNHQLLDSSACLRRRGLGTTRLIHKPSDSFSTITIQPLVTRLSRYSKTSAQLRHVRPALQRQFHELTTNVSHLTNLPR